MDTKKHSVLFILGEEEDVITAILPDICNNLVKKHHDIHFIYPAGISEDFEINMRKVPWIHAHKMPVGGNFSLSKLSIPFSIRQYIKKHDGIDVIHSFGLQCGVLSFLGSMGLKIASVNSPNKFKQSTEKESATALLKLFIHDNISFIFNKLCNKVIFLNEDDQKKSAAHVSYRDITSVLADTTTRPEDLAAKFEQLYSEAILSKNAKNG